MNFFDFISIKKMHMMCYWFGNFDAELCGNLLAGAKKASA